VPEPLLEEVFKVSGVPTFTFVKPVEYTKLLVSLRTPGRGLVIEGPSGIGKTTSVSKALEELGLKEALRLTGRRAEDLDLIRALPEMADTGVVIVDDFHRLPDELKGTLADHMKLLADNEDPKSKLVLVGINRAGNALIQFAPDLNNRIDTIRFEVNPPERVKELVSAGERALDITLNISGQIANEARVASTWRNCSVTKRAWLRKRRNDLRSIVTSKSALRPFVSVCSKIKIVRSLRSLDDSQPDRNFAGRGEPPICTCFDGLPKVRTGHFNLTKPWRRIQSRSRVWAR
jgi:hypothetical protein